MEGQNTALLAFQQLLQASTTQKIKEAEKKLSILSRQDVFLQQVKQILQNTQINKHISTSAAIYITQYSKNVIAKRNPSNVILLNERIVQILQSGSIPLSHKRFICKSLELALVADKTKACKKAVNQKIIATLRQISQNKAQSTNIQFVVLLGQVMMRISSFSKQSVQFMNITFVPYVSLAVQLIDLAYSGIAQQNITKLTKSLQCLVQYTYLIKLYVKRLVINNAQLIKLLYANEIEVLITKTLNINIPSNSFGSSLFIISKDHVQLSRLMNKAKTHAIFISRSVTKIVSVNVKEESLLSINSTFSKMLAYFPFIIDATGKILTEHKLQTLDKSIKQLLEETVLQIKSYTTISQFYTIIKEKKEVIIEKIVFSLLLFNDRQLTNFTEDPQEFFNSLLHVIQRNPEKAFTKEYKQNQLNGQQDDDQEDDTLKTLSAQLLGVICKHIDGIINEIMKFCFMVMRGQLNSVFPKHMVLTVVSLLKNQLNQRDDLLTELFVIVKDYFNSATIPINTPNLKAKNLQFCLTFMILTKYLILFTDFDDSTPQLSFKLVLKILNQQRVEQVAKLICYSTIQMLSTLQINEEQQKYPLQIVQSFTKILSKSPHPSEKILETLYTVIKYNDELLAKFNSKIVDLLKILTEIIKYHMENSPVNKLTVNKCWNVIREIGQNSSFIPALIPDIQNCIMSVIHYLDNRMQEIDFEEDILLLMISFIEKSKQVTKNQLIIFEYIPKIFQHYKLTYGHAFYAIQTFIYYGKDILKVSPLAIKSIIQLCRVSILTKEYQGKIISENDNCQGVLILQSLILSLQDTFDDTVWRQLVKILSQRLEMGSIQFPLLQSNIIATVGLILAKGYKSFTTQQNQLMLRKVLSQLKCFQNVEYSPKVLTVALSQILGLIEIQFIRKQLLFILDAVTTLLQMASNKKQTKKNEQEEQQQNSYRNSLTFLVNSIKDIDEFQNFQLKFDTLKNKYHDLLLNTFNELPEAKKEFLKKIYTTKRVTGGNVRTFIQIKKPLRQQGK